MADCQSAGKAAERPPGGLPSRDRWANQNSMTARPVRAASPMRPPGAPRTGVGALPLRRHVAERTPP
eukprot:10024754-Alexandrium_andersonii.AAC.1